MVPERKPIAHPCVRVTLLAAFQRPMRKPLIPAFPLPGDHANVSDGVRTPKALLTLAALASCQNACELYLQIMQELAQLGILTF